ncbi:MAG: sulfotransferase [Leptolyngbyaceae cyanobacterium]
MQLPNFLVIGAPKSGTTSLYQYLRAHPQVFMSSLKESYFFNRPYHYKDPQRLAEYSALFQNASEQDIAIGEACAQYIYNPKTPGRIHSLIPDVKLIAILRDPAERMYSEYLMACRTGEIADFPDEHELENSFLEFLKKPELNANKYYFQSLKPYLETFDRSQIKVFLFEDLKQDIEKLLRDTFEFLEVDRNVEISVSNKVYNKGGIPKNKVLFRTLETLRSSSRKHLATIFPESVYAKIRDGYSNLRMANMQSKSPKLSSETRKQIIDLHRHDISQLQDFLGRDLSSWLTY